jgi:hypothetical protein
MRCRDAWQEYFKNTCRPAARSRLPVHRESSVIPPEAAADQHADFCLVTDGTQDNQTKGVPNGGWAGSNHATVLNDIANTYPSACANLKNRGIIISVLYIPYQKIKPVNSSFAGDEDDYANNNIPNIPPSLQACASPNFFFAANTPADVTTALNAMFQQSLVTAHTTNRAWRAVAHTAFTSGACQTKAAPMPVFFLALGRIISAWIQPANNRLSSLAWDRDTASTTAPAGGMRLHSMKREAISSCAL